ncbi:hypothetical protein BDK51DRAFT_50639 [Blyttiomyces helicus]|uniref:Uncharacterized protein n=1 Tax=Blyttiomyces helicus TaxID=388810 RepID=A0A4P9WCH9_9FUNG|nr:hypothetical protein BDK51DRAFT_50639 [Blyttiomyces helicus]|eukprot:RKO90214.1 hypothetical protein BDK51DRAFT_50639 [Blyttiomyces helicus]
MDQAIRFRQIEIIRFLHENRREGCSSMPVLDTCLHWAESAKPGREKKKGDKHEQAIKQDKELLSFLHRHYPKGFVPFVMYVACLYRCIQLVRFLVALRPESYSHPALMHITASEVTDAETLSSLYEGGIRFTDDEAQLMLDPTRSPGLQVGVQAVLREMHRLL